MLTNSLIWVLELVLLLRRGMIPHFYLKEDRNSDFWIGNFECVCSDVSNRKFAEAKLFIIAQKTVKALGI